MGDADRVPPARALGGSVGDLPAGGLEPLDELTALAERARFSTLTVDEADALGGDHGVESLREMRHENDAELGRIG